MRSLIVVSCALWVATHVTLCRGGRLPSVAAYPTIASRTPAESTVIQTQAAVSAYLNSLIAPTSSPPSSAAPCPPQPSFCGAGGSSWNSQLPIPTSLNFTRTSGLIAGDNKTCAVINAAGTAWIAAAQSPTIDIGHSFAVFPSGAIAVYPDAPNAAWLCQSKGTTAPSNLLVNGPLYRSAIAGSKDVIVLWEASTTTTTTDAAEQLARASIASLLTDFVSPGDFVGVFPFTEILDTSLTPQLVDASDAVAMARLQSQTASIAFATNSPPADLGGALASLLDVQSASAANGHSALCNTVVLVVTSGGPSSAFVNSVNPEDVIKPLLPAATVVLFSFSTSSAANANATSTFRELNRLACLTGGTSSVVSTSIDMTSSMLEYFVNVQQQLSVWWSSPHLSDFGTGEFVVTAVQPVYNANSTLVAVFGVEVPFSNMSLGGNLTVAEYTRIALLQQQCSPLFPQSLNAAAANALEADDGMICDNVALTVPPASPLTNSRYPLLSISCIAPVALLLIPFVIQQRRNPEPSRGFRWALLIYLALWIVALGVFWGSIWDDIGTERNQSAVTVVTTSVISRRHSCCSVSDCTCTAANASMSAKLTTCSSLVSSGLSGPCLNGFHCCAQQCASCSCDSTSTYCGSCCSCTANVANDLCSATCGICTDLTVFKSYNASGATYRTSTHVSCGLNDTACINAVIASNAVGATVTGYVVTSQPAFLTDQVQVDTASIVVVAIAVALSVIPFSIAVFLAWHVKTDAPSPNAGRRDKSYLSSDVTIGPV